MIGCFAGLQRDDAKREEGGCSDAAVFHLSMKPPVGRCETDGRPGAVKRPVMAC